MSTSGISAKKWTNNPLVEQRFPLLPPLRRAAPTSSRYLQGFWFPTALLALTSRSLSPCKRSQLPALTQAGSKELCLQARGSVAVILPVLAPSWGTAPLFRGFISISLQIQGGHCISCTRGARPLLTQQLGCRIHAAAAPVLLWLRGIQLLLRFFCAGFVTCCNLTWT